ncbi:hypothetical protein ACWCXH_12880 [Kitasatospora sp. NPDC001660]
MTYCTLCQRHLNGALSCPGCGRPAEAAARPQPERPPQAPTLAPPAPRTARRRGTVLAVSAMVLAAGGLATAVVAFGQGDGQSGPVPAGSPTASTPVATSSAPATANPGAATTAKPSAAGTTRPPSTATGARPSATRTTAGPSRPAAQTEAPTLPTPASVPGPTTAAPSAPTQHPPTPTASPTCTHVLFWCTS